MKNQIQLITYPDSLGRNLKTLYDEFIQRFTLILPSKASIFCHPSLHHFIAKLKTAGLDKIIAAKQAQLDQWLILHQRSQVVRGSAIAYQNP
jgi:hypothetical protein